MKLKSVAFAGYCSYNHNITENKLNFNQINVIIGANGAGKSNLVSFLQMISTMMSRGLRHYTALHGGIDSLLYFGQKSTDIMSGNLHITDNENHRETEYCFSLSPSTNGQFFFTNERLASQHNDSEYEAFDIDFGNGHFESNMLDTEHDYVRCMCNYLKQLRAFHFNDTSLRSAMRKPVNVVDDVQIRSDGGNIAAFLWRIRETNFPYYQRILRYVRMILPQLADFYLQEELGRQISLRWQVAGGEEILGAHQMSDGALRFIALTTLLLQPPDTAPPTIILDEPEIGLHPHALAILANEIRMAAKNSQIIVATQSPLLLNHFSADDVITAEYDHTQRKSVLHRHSEEKLSEWLKDYSLGELWEKNVLGGTPL